MVEGCRATKWGGSTFSNTCFFLRDIDNPENCHQASSAVTSSFMRTPVAPPQAPPRACVKTLNTDNTAPGIVGQGRVAATTPEECCVHCDAVDECTVAVYEEGFCYLKSGDDHSATQKPSPGRVQVAPVKACFHWPNKSPVPSSSNRMLPHFKPTETTAECCAWCQQTEGCSYALRLKNRPDGLCIPFKLMKDGNVKMVDDPKQDTIQPKPTPPKLAPTPPKLAPAPPVT